MNKLYFFYLLLFSLAGFSQQSFVTTWEIVENPLINKYIVIPTINTLDYNYSIDFGDGSPITNNVTGNITHYYDLPGTYTVTISGEFPAIKFTQSQIQQSEKKIKSIEQWGNIQWQTMNYAFAGCVNLSINATDTPDLSQVTDMSFMFSNSSVNQPINNWNVSNISNMSNMFSNTVFNQPLNDWDVSGVVNMHAMFSNSTFNQPLNNWDVSNVINMESMFVDSQFDQPLNDWNVSSVTNMTNMFNNSIFNQPLNNWDVYNVTEMYSMFYEASSFNQNINDWDVSNVTNMEAMFYLATSFDQPLSDWNTESVTDMNFMFYGTSSFNQNINDWDVSNVTNMHGMFSEATLFNQPLNNWDVSNVMDMTGMFDFAFAFNQLLNNWDVSNVEIMTGMFFGAISYNQPLDNWQFSPSVLLQGMIDHTAISVENYDLLLAKFQELEYPDKNFGALDLKYCNIEAHDYLVNTLNWNIQDAGISEDCMLAINTNNKAEVIVYPNPSKRNIYINSDVLIEKVEVFDITGKQIEINKNTTNQIDISNFAKGQYIIKIYTQKDATVKKIIKI